METDHVLVDQGGTDIAVPSDLDTFEVQLLDLVNSVRAQLQVLVGFDSPSLIVRFISLPTFSDRVAVLEIEGMSGKQSAVTVALRDRNHWEVITPMEKWPIHGPRAVAAMTAFLEFHNSIPALCNQILWLVEASWGSWSKSRSEFPEYGDRHWILQQPEEGGDAVSNLIAGRGEEALEAMIEANALSVAAQTYRSVKVGRRQTGMRTPQVNRNGVLMPKVAGLTAIELHELQVIESAKYMLKGFGDDVALNYYPVAIDTHNSPDPMLEIEFLGSVVMALRLVGGARWEAVRGFPDYSVKKYLDGDEYDDGRAWHFKDSPLLLLVQIFFVFRPDCDRDVRAKWNRSPTAGRVAQKCGELKSMPVGDRSLEASWALNLWNLVLKAEQEMLDEHERSDPFDGCVGDGDCPAGCWYCDDYKDRHRAGECGGHCFLC